MATARVIRKRKASSPILAAVHETARDLRSAGFIDKRRMQDYDALWNASASGLKEIQQRGKRRA